MGKLIVFDGMSTTGKSTVSSIVFKKLNADGQCVWFHEENREHPTRIDERDAWENSERFRLMWHDRWKRFLSEADANDITYVFDGCIFHELERTFLRNGWAHSVIKELFADLNELFSRHDVTLFLLYKRDLLSSFERTFALRNSQWELFKKKQLQAVQERYFKEPFEDTALGSLIERIQDTMRSFFQEMTVSKYELDATSEEWELIAETAIRLWKAGSMFQKSVNVSGIIWPTAAHLCREITEDLKNSMSVVWCKESQIYTIDPSLLRWIVHWAYRYDWIPEKIEEKKYSDMIERCDGSKLSVVLFQIAMRYNTYCLDNRDQRMHLQSVKLLKTDFRERYNHRIRNYVHDILMHLSDTVDQTLALMCVHQILELIRQHDVADYFVEDRANLVLRVTCSKDQIITHFAPLMQSQEITGCVDKEFRLFYRDECLLSVREKESIT